MRFYATRRRISETVRDMVEVAIFSIDH